MNFYVHSCQTFDIIDERSYYQATYNELRVTLDERLFLVNGPFMMDSQFEALKREGRRIRKRKKSTSASPELIEEITRIEKISKEIRETGNRLGYFTAQCEHDNNRVARTAASELMNQAVVWFNPETISSPEIVPLEDNSSFILSREYCMLNSWYRNESESCIRLNVSVKEGEAALVYYVPPRSTFHVGPVIDIRNFAALNDETFDLIVMDPPWENLTVRRQRSYATCDSALNGLNMDCLAPNGLVAIWITNRKGIEKDVESYLKRWNLEKLATFFWLKVTIEGEPVCPFNGDHKLPYEKLVIASRAEAAFNHLPITSADGKVYASIPMAVPSRKPPVVPILKQYGFFPSQCLELFARSLQPNTVSVGFETLLLQSSSCFISTSN
ncbi:unnamed protein product [Cylicocyclus nassatus]|uniref:Uncharacterized protein n=1 Tax=Cylicocyclus nassatus TaxID=53992 RepID=A0AA36HAR9_CYLNA|nr:unnamed protein product [Cylicocyclus nassatus]